jgi:hypothetical protein
MEDPAAWGDSLSALVRNRVDLRAFHVFDRGELGLAFDRPIRLRSPETGDELPIDPVAARDAFADVVNEWFGEVRRAVHRRRGRHYAVAADDNLHRVLVRFIEARA